MTQLNMHPDDETDFWLIVQAYVEGGGYSLEQAKKIAFEVIEEKNWK